MWNNLMHFEAAPLNLVVRGVVVYLSILILLRISGKRQVGQMGATEFVSILLISNAVQNSMNAGDNSLIGGLLLAVVLIALTMLIAFFSYRNRMVQAIFEGTPRLLIHDGKILDKALEAELLNRSDLRILLRKQGVHHFHEVKTAILESDGTLSINRFTD